MVKKKVVSVREKIKENPWILSTLIFGVLTIVLLLTSIMGDIQVSSEKAGENFVDFINSRGESQIEYVSSEDFGPNFYSVTILADGQESAVQITKDGKYFLYGQLVPLVQEVQEVQEVEEPEVQDSIKSDKPLVQLFVMTHCPYGTQAEKGFLPVARLLEGVADLEIRFVHYFMHEPEEAETPRQICIREEQGDKFLDYLECFLEGDGVSEGGYVKNGNNPSTCMERANIDEKLVQDCIDSGRADEYYEADSTLSQEVGVRGSPTLVINGGIVSAGRSEDAYLGATCESFSDVPELCATEVSTASPSVYFGWDEIAAPASANVCG